MRVKLSCIRGLAAGLGMMLAAGCSTSTIETRRSERLDAYHQLAPEDQRMVDEGQIKIGMSSDAVYIAWGPPAQVLESEDSQGRYTTWLYHGTWMQENRYWAYRETRRGHTDLYLERYLISDYNPRDYLRAQIDFVDGRVASWRTLPRPLD